MINFLVTASAQPKNFAKENVHRIKEIQKANREKQREAMTTEPVKAVYKPGKFDHVDSKVAQEVKVWTALISYLSSSVSKVSSRLWIDWRLQYLFVVWMLALVGQRLDSAIHWINLSPVESAIGFPNTYPLDSDLSGR